MRFGVRVPRSAALIAAGQQRRQHRQRHSPPSLNPGTTSAQGPPQGYFRCARRQIVAPHIECERGNAQLGRHNPRMEPSLHLYRYALVSFI